MLILHDRGRETKMDQGKCSCKLPSSKIHIAEFRAFRDSSGMRKDSIANLKNSIDTGEGGISCNYNLNGTVPMHGSHVAGHWQEPGLHTWD